MAAGNVPGMPGTVFGGKVPVTEMAHCVAAHQRLLFTLQGFDDESARHPSLLPDWSRAHVLAHLARDAESQERMLRGLMRDEHIPQYAGGSAGRRKAINDSVRQDAEALVDDYRSAGEALFSAWQAMPDDLWDRAVHTLRGPVEAAETAWVRWHELEVHHVDLDLGFTQSDWPAAYVTTALSRVMASLTERAWGKVPPARWVVEVTDRDGEWTIDTTAEEGPTIHPEAADGDARISGPAHAVLAWILGRPLIEELDVEGDRAEEARELPSWFPLP